jgi:HPt (histidine-containing phosphotransfer) domain-containing protein
MGFDTAAVEWSLPEALQELVSCGEQGIVVEVLSLFRTDTASRLRELRAAVESGNRKVVRAQAHSLKGSAVQVGANSLAEACREMELTADTRPELVPLLEEIETRFRAVSKAISLDYGAAE